MEKVSRYRERGNVEIGGLCILPHAAVLRSVPRHSDGATYDETRVGSINRGIVLLLVGMDLSWSHFVA